MDDINATISYQWRFGWSGEKTPIVNPLLKAILEQDVPAMERFFNQGASLAEVDENTFERALYFVVDNYDVMKCLVDHGFSEIHNFIRKATKQMSLCVSGTCTSPEGFTSGLSGRAYFLGAYDVMELLVENGFDTFFCYEKGWAKARKADEEIFRIGDKRGIRILMEHGFSLDCDYYAEYVLNRPQVIRKSVGLDPRKFSSEIPPCGAEKVPLLFGRSEAQTRNARRREDYEDRLRAWKQFKCEIGADVMRVCQCYKENNDRELGEALQRLARSL